MARGESDLPSGVGLEHFRFQEIITSKGSEPVSDKNSQGALIIANFSQHICWEHTSLDGSEKSLRYQPSRTLWKWEQNRQRSIRSEASDQLDNIQNTTVVSSFQDLRWVLSLFHWMRTSWWSVPWWILWDVFVFPDCPYHGEEGGCFVSGFLQFTRVVCGSVWSRPEYLTRIRAIGRHDKLLLRDFLRFMLLLFFSVSPIRVMFKQIGCFLFGSFETDFLIRLSRKRLASLLYHNDDCIRVKLVIQSYGERLVREQYAFVSKELYAIHICLGNQKMKTTVLHQTEHFKDGHFKIVTDHTKEQVFRGRLSPSSKSGRIQGECLHTNNPAWIMETLFMRFHTFSQSIPQSFSNLGRPNTFLKSYFPIKPFALTQHVQG